MEFAQGRDASFYHSGSVRLSDAGALWRAGTIRQWRKLLGRRGADAGSDPEPPFRLDLDKAVAKGTDWRKQLNAWWKTAPAFDKRWTIGSLISVVAGLLGLLIYASSKQELVGYLQRAGFPDQQLADSIAQFSLHEVMLFVLMLIVSVGLLTLIMSGVLSGLRSRWGVVALGVLLVIDLARADAPWIVYWNYKE